MIGLESSMDVERWRKVEGLFHAALEQDPDARQAFLDVACAGDAELRQQVELLLTLGHVPSEQGGMEECICWLKGFVQKVPVELVAR